MTEQPGQPQSQQNGQPQSQPQGHQQQPQVNLEYYANSAQCILCRGWVPREQALAVNSLPPHEQGLVRLEGLASDHEAFVCSPCLEHVKTSGSDVNQYLNAFAHLESYHQIMQAIGRAFIGVFLISNLFVTTHVVALALTTVVFVLCDWQRLGNVLWTIITFPPLLVAIIFVPWTVTIVLGTRPFTFARLIDNPLYYCPWKTITFFDETFIEGIFYGFLVLGILYVFAVFSTSYLNDIEAEDIEAEDIEDIDDPTAEA